MSRFLLVAHQTAGSRELRDHARRVAAADPGAEFTLLVPATPPSYWHAWDEMEARTLAAEAAEQAAAGLRAAGLRVYRVVVGGREPMPAIADEVREGGPYDGLVVCTLPPGLSRWLRLDLVNRARTYTGLPVEHVVARHTVPVPRPAMAAAPAAEMGPLTRGRRGRADGAAVLERPLEAAARARASLPAADPAQVHDRMFEGDGGGPLYQAMAANPDALRGYVAMLRGLWRASGLPAELRELVILRTAQLARNAYLWHEHVAVARAMGIADERIVALEHWRSSEHVRFDERERAVLAFTDASFGSHDVEAARVLAAGHLSPGGVVALSLTSGFARMTATFAAAMGVEPGERFVGWQLY